MKAVVDASFALDFLLPDEHSVKVIEVFKKYQEGELFLVAPVILPFEVLNGLKSAFLSKRVEDRVASDLLRVFLELGIEFIEIDLQKVLMFAFEREVSVYDASYAVLAQMLNAPLLTQDRKLAGLVRA